MSRLNIEGSEEEEGHDQCGRASGKKGPHSSSVWNVSGFAPDDDLQKQAICMHPGIVKTKSGNTINLLHHLERCHKIQHQQSTKDNPKEKEPVARPHQHLELKHYITHRHVQAAPGGWNLLLAKDTASINTVENDGFKHLVKSLDKRCCDNGPLVKWNRGPKHEPDGSFHQQ